jgi:hypothetical protein
MISIITPTLLRNELVRCCQSLEKQKLPWQHIVMVDMPADEAYNEPVYAKILSQISHPKRDILFCPVRHDNYGNTCRHNAAEHCTGEYIGYLDDDDYLTDDALEIFEETIEKTNHPDIVGCNARWRGREVFFHKPIQSARTVQGQYLHRREIGGMPIKWPDTPIGFKSYGVDGEFIEYLKTKASTSGYADHNRPVCVIERPSKGRGNPFVKDYTLLLTTHKHPEEAGKVMHEMWNTTEGMSRDILVIGHEQSDHPAGGRKLPPFRFDVQPKKGCANSIWHGAHHCVGKWFVWLCDDHEYPVRDWLKQADALRKQVPTAKVIKFNAGTGHRECASIGMAETKWYREHYPEPVYEHYGWDNEIQEWAIRENVFLYAKRILIKDTVVSGKINWEIKRRDWARWQSRRKV